jgi:hypothetical protein
MEGFSVSIAVILHSQQSGFQVDFEQMFITRTKERGDGARWTLASPEDEVSLKRMEGMAFRYSIEDHLDRRTL